MSIRDAWLEFNAARGGMQNRLMQQNLPEFMGVMGMNYRPEQTDQSGLTYGGAGTPGGLMAGDLQDPRTWLTAGMGLMSLPGYQQMGNQMLNSVMQQQLALPMQQAQAQRQAEIDRLQQRKQMMDLMLKEEQLAKMDRDITSKQLSEYSAWERDYYKKTQPLRVGLQQSNTALQRIAETGIYDASNTDMMGVIAALLKLRDPTSVIQQGEYDAMIASRGADDIVRAALQMMKVNAPIPNQVKQDLVNSLNFEEKGKQRELDLQRRQAAATYDEYQLRGPGLLPELQRPDYGEINRQLDLPVPPDLPTGGGSDMDSSIPEDDQAELNRRDEARKSWLEQQWDRLF